MENKQVGWLIIGIGIVMAIIVWMFNNVIKESIGLTCSHGPTCGMYAGVNVQTWISLSIIVIILVIGVAIMYTQPKERIVIKRIKERKKKLDLSDLNKGEKEVVKLLQDEGGAIFQATLMEKLGVGKVGMTRLLDKLESKGITERKRRGMNNIVILKT